MPNLIPMPIPGFGSASARGHSQKDFIMDRNSVIKLFQPEVMSSIAKNASKYTLFHLDAGTPGENILGFYADPKPATGTVVAIKEGIVLVKIDRAAYYTFPADQAAPIVVNVGEKISITPYARRRFDGTRLDEARVETQTAADGTQYSIRRMILGEQGDALPVPEAKCEYLRDTLRYLKDLKVPGQHRTISNMLVDANATDFQTVDPSDENVIATPPCVSFSVSTVKFQGRVAVVFDRAKDEFRIELYRGDVLVECVDRLNFDDLAETLESLIDDGSWCRLKIELIAPAKKVRKAA